MKRLLFILLAVALFSQSCVKANDECTSTDSPVVAPANEVTDLQNYINSRGITAIKHPSGFFYHIVDAGSGTTVSNLCAQVTVRYSGTLTNGNVFDETQPGQTINLILNRVIVGWQKAIPLVAKGGRINMYIPPSLGYGSIPRNDAQGNVLIPANSILVFTVDVVDIQNL